ncbi:hypothetical protein DYY66_2167 [Candidatus Nitrosotalea sp. FS]|nr:hypothetical protein [Candidatus Nitrosotalea sp. FS]
MDETDMEELNFKMLDKNTMLATGDVEIDTVNEILKSIFRVARIILLLVDSYMTN